MNNKTNGFEERFIGFESLEFANSAGTLNAIFWRLKKIRLDLGLCRSQTYDGASVMSGYKNGLKKKSKKNNLKRYFFIVFLMF